jgi:hypothetical protein
MSNDVPRICYDRILPRDLVGSALNRSPSEDTIALELAVFKSKKWAVGSTLRVRFLEGTNVQKDIVRDFAPKWSEHANLKLEFGNAVDAEIRIAFGDDGAWSYIGTDCLEIPRDQPTMNLGWQDESVVLHEFGHAIGLIHEHQNPSGGINWNRPAVIRDLSGPPNFWDEATIQHNIFDKYSVDLLNASTLDPQSIMMYRIPASWTTDGFHAEFNAVLSAVDKAFIGDAVNYPFAADDGAVELPVSVIESRQGDIGVAGEQDLYRFQVEAPGRYAVETAGVTDLVLALYGPDSKTTLVAQDDDSGVGRNPRVERDLGAGRYYVQVRHYNRNNGTGTYTVQVTTT